MGDIIRAESESKYFKEVHKEDFKQIENALNFISPIYICIHQPDEYREHNYWKRPEFKLDVILDIIKDIESKKILHSKYIFDLAEDLDTILFKIYSSEREIFYGLSIDNSKIDNILRAELEIYIKKQKIDIHYPTKLQ